MGISHASRCYGYINMRARPSFLHAGRTGIQRTSIFTKRRQRQENVANVSFRSTERCGTPKNLMLMNGFITHSFHGAIVFPACTTRCRMGGPSQQYTGRTPALLVTVEAFSTHPQHDILHRFFAGISGVRCPVCRSSPPCSSPAARRATQLSPLSAAELSHPESTQRWLLSRYCYMPLWAQLLRQGSRVYVQARLRVFANADIPALH